MKTACPFTSRAREMRLNNTDDNSKIVRTRWAFRRFDAFPPYGSLEMRLYGPLSCVYKTKSGLIETTIDVLFPRAVRAYV